MSASPALNRSRTTRDSGLHPLPVRAGGTSCQRCTRFGWLRRRDANAPQPTEGLRSQARGAPRTQTARIPARTGMNQGAALHCATRNTPKGVQIALIGRRATTATVGTVDFGHDGGTVSALRRAVRIAGRAERHRADQTRSTPAHVALDHEQTESDVYGLMRTSAPMRRSIAVNWARLGLPEGPTYIQLLCTAQPTRDSASSITYEYRQTHWAAGSRAISPASRTALTCT